MPVRIPARGKHVYCGGPLGCNTDEAVRMLDAAERRGIPYNVAQLYRRLAEGLRETNAVSPARMLASRVSRTQP